MGLVPSKESMPSSGHPPLTGNDALGALHRAETIDDYRNQVAMSSPNRIARNNLKYVPSIHIVNRDIEDTEGWPSGQVIWMDPDSDRGLPHTRPPRYICLSKSIPQETLKSTLLHERVHLSQRFYPKEWVEIMKAWSMEPWNGMIHSDILLRKRLNPDLLLSPTFCWKGEWVPLGIFKSLNMPDLSDIDIVWWHIPSRTLRRQAPDGWEDYFGKVDSGHEHPYELSAYLIEHNKDCKALNDLKPRLKEIQTKA